MNTHQCTFCDRQFHFKDLFEQHVPMCEFFYQSKRQRQRDHETMEPIPSPYEMMKLVQTLVFEQELQKERIRKLEAIIRSRKHDVLSYTPVPNKLFHEWVVGFHVTYAHLERVFQYDLFEGIKMCMNERIDQEGVHGVPVRTPVERPNTLYLYGTQRKWVVCDSQEFLFLLEQLMTLFLELYCRWEDENAVMLQSSQENRDKQVLYMIKLTGSGTTYKEKHRQELRTWLCKKVTYHPVPP
jgi:hypothetical protein